MTNRIIATLLFISCHIFVFAQNTYTISGTVKDAKETLPGAAIYLGGYKISTVTDHNGKFILPKLTPGNYEILVQMMGYIPYAKSIEIADKSINIEVLLKENTTMLKEVVIKPDPNRAYYLALFKDFFIGKTPNANDCKILNTNVLIIDDNKSESLVTVKATDFLIVENKALGYRLKYMLEYFEYDYKAKIVFFAGHPSFEEMNGNQAKQKRWVKNRQIAYNGSIQHFFKSLYKNKIVEEGFAIHKIAKRPNLQRPPDSLINANIKRLTAGQSGLVNVLTFDGTDSLSYWLKRRKEPKEYSVLSRKDVLVDTLVKKVNDDLKMMKYEDELYVIYKNEKETASFNASSFKQNRPLDLVDYQISILQLMQPSVSFYENGAIADPRSLLYKGFWAYEKIADMVPLDYLTTTIKKP